MHSNFAAFQSFRVALAILALTLSLASVHAAPNIVAPPRKARPHFPFIESAEEENAKRHTSGRGTTAQDERVAAVDNVIAIGPREVYFGDAFYVARASNAVTPGDFVVERYDARFSDDVIVILSHGDDSYLYRFPSLQLQNRSKAIKYYEVEQTNRDEMKLNAAVIAETPPIEDWDASFWQTALAEVQEKGAVKLEIRVRMPVSSSNFRFKRYKWFVDSILVKKRPDSEMAILDSWYRNYQTAAKLQEQRRQLSARARAVYLGTNDVDPTPEIGAYPFHYCREITIDTLDVNVSSLVQVDNIRRLSLFGCAHSNDRGFASVRIPIIDFWRLGARKPEIQFAPQSRVEWQMLENSFSPGAVKDEIHLAILTQEYLAARNLGATNESEKARALTQWLRTRPYPQKLAFIATLYAKLPQLIPEFQTLTKENVEGASVRVKACSSLEFNDLALYETLVETTQTLDPLVASGTDQFKYSQEVENYKTRGDEAYREEIKTRRESSRLPPILELDQLAPHAKR